MQIYLADFSGPYSACSRAISSRSETDEHEYRFVDIVDLRDATVKFKLEHEIRSMRHPLFGRPLVNRNPAQTNRAYVRGQDAFESNVIFAARMTSLHCFTSSARWRWKSCADPPATSYPWVKKIERVSGSAEDRVELVIQALDDRGRGLGRRSHTREALDVDARDAGLLHPRHVRQHPACAARR